MVEQHRTAGDVSPERLIMSLEGKEGTVLLGEILIHVLPRLLLPQMRIRSVIPSMRYSRYKDPNRMSTNSVKWSERVDVQRKVTKRRDAFRGEGRGGC